MTGAGTLKTTFIEVVHKDFAARRLALAQHASIYHKSCVSYTTGSDCSHLPGVFRVGIRASPCCIHFRYTAKHIIRQGPLHVTLRLSHVEKARTA